MRGVGVGVHAGTIAERRTARAGDPTAAGGADFAGLAGHPAAAAMGGIEVRVHTTAVAFGGAHTTKDRARPCRADLSSGADVATSPAVGRVVLRPDAHVAAEHFTRETGFGTAVLGTPVEPSCIVVAASAQ